MTPICETGCHRFWRTIAYASDALHRLSRAGAGSLRRVLRIGIQRNDEIAAYAIKPAIIAAC
ncbi:hypothetical protein KCP75_11880 [Salmonella enterica subsp. enterica]|nr:hypothetical protein KCP75_11880 [Salmonella enterica subsp. enterica]